MTPSGIEPATFRLVAQSLKQLGRYICNVVVFTDRPLHPPKTDFQKEVRQKAGWLPEPVTTLWTRKKKRKKSDHPANRNSIPRSSSPWIDVVPNHLSRLKYYICTTVFVIYSAEKIESAFTQKSIGCLFCKCMDHKKEFYCLIKLTGVSFVLPVALGRSL